MGGFSSVEGDTYGTIMYADNVSFDGTARGGKVTANGQLLIGAATAPFLRPNTLTAGTGVGIVNGAGTITISVNGAVVGQTLTGDSGGALSPTAGNWNILGQQAGTVPVMITTGSGSTLSVENRTWLTQLVVDPSSTVGLRGTFTTIAAALTAAVSGQDVFIRPGTYTENLTLKAGVNLLGFKGDADTPQVIISGNTTASFAGTASISNIRLQTNSANCLTISGNLATVLNFFNCYINASNNTAISFTSSSGSAVITLRYCFLNMATTGIALYSSSAAGALQFEYCKVDNTGSSTTASSNSAGVVSYKFCTGTFVVSTSSTGTLVADYSIINAGPYNVTAVTTAGTGSAQLIKCEVSGGSASAVSVGSGTTFQLLGCRISSSNTNAVTGAGTATLVGNIFTDTSSKSNITTQTGGTINGMTQGTTPSLGYLGEIITATGTSVNLNNGTDTNITSISITPGVWDVSGMVAIGCTGAFTTKIVGILTTSGSLSGRTDGVNSNLTQVTGTGATITLVVSPLRVLLSATTTYYLLAQSAFTTGSSSGTGKIAATRVG